MLYEALTGRLPFLGQPLEVLMDKQRFEPPSPRELITRLPEDLCSLRTDLLRRDPKARPSRNDVLRRLGSTSGESENPNSTPPQIMPLVGREREFQALESAFAEVTRGQTVVLMVQGRSGAGKTALVNRFLDSLVARDEAVVLMGRCYEREAVPYKALDSLIDALSHYLKRWPASDVQGVLPRDIRPLLQVFPALRHIVPASALPHRAVDIPDPHQLRRRAFAGLRELMARLGDRKPLVLFIDDLQWSDQDSASLLSELMEPPDPPLVLLIEPAIKLYRLALASSPGGDADAQPLRMKLGDALANSGRGAEAAREYLAAISGSNAALACGLRRRAAQQYLISGHIDEGLTVLRTVRGADFQSRSLLLALRSGEPSRIARGLAVEAGHVSSGGPRSRRRADRLIRAAGGTGQTVGPSPRPGSGVDGQGGYCPSAGALGRQHYSQRRGRGDASRAMHRRRLGAECRAFVRTLVLGPRWTGRRSESPPTGPTSKSGGLFTRLRSCTEFRGFAWTRTIRDRACCLGWPPVLLSRIDSCDRL